MDLALTEARRYRRGYRPRYEDEIRERLKAFERTCLPCSIAWALAYHISILLIASAVLWIFEVTPVWVSVAVYVAALLMIARQQRGLELMVHDASHGAWYQASKPWNHFLANLLVGIPLLSTVEGYWESHKLHHGRYGSDLDPCRRRFERMGLGKVDLSTTWAIIKAIIRWLPSYNAEYYREIGSRSLNIASYYLTWHLIVFLLPLSLMFGLASAIVLWILFWAMPLLITLPVLRSVAEAEEHDYERGDTEFNTTFNNHGLIHRVCFHPWNDEYHLLHHLYPSIPQRLHHKVHRLLMEHDESYRSALHRSTLLQQL